MAKQGIIIIALVAMVALVGLLLFGSASTGAIPGCPYHCMSQGPLGNSAWICTDVECGPMPTSWTPQDYSRGVRK